MPFSRLCELPTIFQVVVYHLDMMVKLCRLKQNLVPNFSRTNGLKYILNCIVDEWNSLPNHIRESNSIETFKKNVSSFIKDN